MSSPAAQLDELVRGAEQVVTPAELQAKLELGRPLRVKLGCDPTAPDLHLGHSVVLRKLRQFQDLGHRAILIVGDYTAMIGDPTGQNTTRPMLAESDIARNAQTYFDQAGKVLDTDPDKLEIRRNSEWLGRMNLADTIRLCSQMTVARMLERDTFEKRHRADEPIGVHEFLYPLMQGHDSVVVEADIELGGTDQLFNNLVGRQLQKQAGQDPQVVMVMPILEGTDGVEKMSKSKGNYIGLAESPKEMFGKTMSISDELMWSWYRLLFQKGDPEIAALQQGHPMDIKKDLAETIVAQYHDAAVARQSREDFEAQFSKKDYSEVAATLSLPAGEIWILELVEKTGKFTSRGEIRRLVRGGGVSLDGEKISDPQARVTPASGQVLKAGKLTVVKLAVE